MKVPVVINSQKTISSRSVLRPIVAPVNSTSTSQAVHTDGIHKMTRIMPDIWWMVWNTWYLVGRQTVLRLVRMYASHA